MARESGIDQERERSGRAVGTRREREARESG